MQSLILKSQLQLQLSTLIHVELVQGKVLKKPFLKPMNVTTNQSLVASLPLIEKLMEKLQNTFQRFSLKLLLDQVFLRKPLKF